MIDPRSPRAVYRQLADLLRAQIEAGAHPPGALLPSSRRLEQEHDVSRLTVSRALEVLRDEGLVVGERGYGTRVREPEQRQEVPVPRGARLRSRMPRSDEERAELDIEPGAVTPVVVITIGGRERRYNGDRCEFTIR